MKFVRFFTIIMLLVGVKIMQAEPQHVQKQPVLTVWVHGTTLTYKFGVAKQFFYVPTGITPMKDIKEKYHCRLIGSWLVNADSEQFPEQSLYFFGWSGDLSATKRKNAARDLYKGLEALVADYESKFGCRPFVRVITHSHGGNVVLNLTDYATGTFVIDELVLLACPVQQETAHNIDSAIFGRILHFYSTDDMIQVVDPQGLWFDKKGKRLNNLLKKKTTLFSKRCFEERPNLTQILVKSSSWRGIWHIDFLLKPFLTQLPIFLKKYRSVNNSHEKIKLVR